MANKYIVKIYDKNGNLILETEEVKAKVKASTITLSGDKFFRNDVIEIIATAENAIAGEQEPIIEEDTTEGGA